MQKHKQARAHRLECLEPKRQLITRTRGAVRGGVHSRAAAAESRLVGPQRAKQSHHVTQ